MAYNNQERYFDPNRQLTCNNSLRTLGYGAEDELQDQLQRASALNILINAISVWNTVYLTEAVKFLKTNGNVDESLLHHIFPLGFEHINFLGEYKFDDDHYPALARLRPLRLSGSD